MTPTLRSRRRKMTAGQRKVHDAIRACQGLERKLKTLYEVVGAVEFQLKAANAALDHIRVNSGEVVNPFKGVLARAGEPNSVHLNNGLLD